MSSKLAVLTFAAILSISYGFTIRDIWDYLLGGGYSQYPYGNHPGNYPSGSGLYPGGQYGGQYGGHGGQYGGQYGGPGGQYGGYRPGLEGPPGAHPGCPLCDSSVYSYCSHKQAHDACCCENSAYLPFSCRNRDCKSIYANSCEEYHLITNCCCVDLQKNAIIPPVLAPVVV